MSRPSKNPNLIRIVAIDPATSAMGITVIDYDKKTTQSVLQKSITVYGNKLLKSPEILELSKIYDRQFSVLSAIHLYILNNIFKTYKPHYIVVESAFCNRAFVTAYATLTLVIHEIRRAAYEYFKQDVFLIAPKSVKKEIAQFHEASKDDMKNAILNRKELNLSINTKAIDVDKMTQHEFDSAAQGVCFVRTVLPGILLGTN